MFLVVLLGLCAGLRKGEIDLLPWSAVKFDAGQIRIEPTEYFEVKTEHSIGDVPLDPEILEILHGAKARARSPFVVPSRRAPGQTLATNHRYRCQPVFDRVTAWLKARGVSARKPLHALRKEYGSLINAKYDLVTAKELLRHSSVAITAAHYVENRKRGTTGLGAVLAPTKRNEKEIVTDQTDGPPEGFPALQFQFAKSMPDTPHWYVVRSPENEAEYVELFHRIGEEGVWEKWKNGHRYQYLYLDGFKYWRMTSDVRQSRVINRTKVAK